MRYVAFLHDDDDPGFGISFPDFPGCVSDGDTVDDALRRGAEALSFHVEGMLADGEPIPRPRSLHDIKADDSRRASHTERFVLASGFHHRNGAAFPGRNCGRSTGRLTGSDSRHPYPSGFAGRQGDGSRRPLSCSKE